MNKYTVFTIYYIAELAMFGTDCHIYDSSLKVKCRIHLKWLKLLVSYKYSVY